jgi:hypothetical protein
MENLFETLFRRHSFPTKRIPLSQGTLFSIIAISLLWITPAKTKNDNDNYEYPNESSAKESIESGGANICSHGYTSLLIGV